MATKFSLASSAFPVYVAACHLMAFAGTALALYGGAMGSWPAIVAGILLAWIGTRGTARMLLHAVRGGGGGGGKIEDLLAALHRSQTASRATAETEN